MYICNEVHYDAFGLRLNQCVNNFEYMREVTQEQVDSFLKGSNPQERIIKVECANNESEVSVIYIDDKGVKRIQKDNLYPFCWAKQAAGRAMFGGNREVIKKELNRAGIACKPLRTKDMDGKEPERMANGYRVMFYATRPMSHNDFLKFFKRAGTPIYGNDDDTDERNFMIVSPVEQYLIYTGKRFFKGYDNYDDLHRAQWDLETEGLDPHTCAISQIGLRDNRGYEKIITIDGATKEEKFENELKGIDEFFSSLAQIKPDILSGHNTENFDWNFIDVRLELHGLDMKEYSKKFFPKGVYKKDKETVLKLGGEQEYYFPTVMWGFNLTDSLFAVRRAQALDSSMKKSTLKYATKYSKIAKANRVYVDGKIIDKTWLDLEPHYCFNDENGHWILFDENATYRVYDENAFNAQYKPLEYDEEYYLATAKENYDPYDHCDAHGLPDNADELFDQDGRFIGEYDEELLNSLKKEYYEEDLAKDKERAWNEWKKKNYKYSKRFVRDGNNVHDNVTDEDYDQFVTGRYIVERYLLDDLWETDKVECRFNESNFLVGKMLPVSYERMCTMGTAAIWKYIMMAWSYENGLAIPSLIQARKFTGGLSRLLSVGYNPRVVKLDYNSLYPSIILTYGISTEIDVMGAMAAMLDYILTQRELYKGLKADYGAKAKEIKKQIKENSNLTKMDIAELTKKMDEASMLAARNDKLQLPLKITGNGYFGSFGSGGVFPWSDIVCAEETTCIGRQALRLMIGHFSNIGNNTKVTVKMSELTVDSVVFIKYDDDNSIERKKVSDVENDTFQRPFKILTDKGWCMNGIYEAV